MQLGKFNNDRDSALHWLCTYGWANASFGSVEAPTGFVWRISITEDEVKSSDTELAGVLENWFEQEGDVENTPEFRRLLVGHFILTESDQGFVSVTEFPNEFALMEEFRARAEDFGVWEFQTEPCEWFVNRATVPAWCCNTHMYDGTGDFPATGEHPDTCPFVED